MSKVLVIAEAASTWRFGEDHLANAYRSIRAAKGCGADCWKCQYVSDGHALAKRRGMDSSAGEMYQQYVHFPASWLPLLKAECDRVGIAFGCTVFLSQDVGVVSPFTDFVKVAARESNDKTLREEWKSQRGKRRMFVSLRKDENGCYADDDVERLHCVSKYPTPIDEFGLDGGMIPERVWVRDGISDHTAHVLTGAVAVGAGARIIESHVRLHDTPKECPDYPHSLYMYEKTTEFNKAVALVGIPTYNDYVRNVRDAERMM